jgi:hypothetical protein
MYLLLLFALTCTLYSGESPVFVEFVSKVSHAPNPKPSNIIIYYGPQHVMFFMHAFYAIKVDPFYEAKTDSFHPLKLQLSFAFC